MPIPTSISQPKQLLVEGQTAKYFFEAMQDHLGLEDIQLQNFGGIDELRGYLKALRNTPYFEEEVISLGIIRDAEDNPAGAFQSVCNALHQANLSIPSQPEIPAGNDPQINVLILPGAARAGMLETICLESLRNLPVIACIDQYFECIAKSQIPTPNNMDKARVQAFLAAQERPGLLLGQAAKCGYWPWDSPAFHHVRQFLQAL